MKLDNKYFRYMYGQKYKGLLFLNRVQSKVKECLQFSVLNFIKCYTQYTLYNKQIT